MMKVNYFSELPSRVAEGTIINVKYNSWEAWPIKPKGDYLYRGGRWLRIEGPFMREE